MLMLAIIFALTGVALGLRFKVLVLVPASGFAVASPILMNLAYSYSLRMQALATDYDCYGASRLGICWVSLYDLR